MFCFKVLVEFRNLVCMCWEMNMENFGGNNGKFMVSNLDGVLMGFL